MTEVTLQVCSGSRSLAPALSPCSTRTRIPVKVTFPGAWLFLCEKKIRVCIFKESCCKSLSIASPHSFIHSHLCQTSNLFNADIESEQVQGLLAHRRQTWDWGASLLHEGEVSVYPQLSLWLIPQFIHLCDLFASGGGWAGLLESRRSIWRWGMGGQREREEGEKKVMSYQIQEEKKF